MAAILSTNMASLYAQKNLSTAQASLSDSVQRLSSGTRINSAKDDAAGYGIAESIKGTKAITDQSILNTKNAISQVQTAEGALDVVGKILQRALTLTTQRQDGTLNTDQTNSINNEIASLLNEVQNVKERTQFNGSTVSVFGATNAVTTGAGVTSTIEIANLSLGSMGTTGAPPLPTEVSMTLGTQGTGFEYQTEDGTTLEGAALQISNLTVYDSYFYDDPNNTPVWQRLGNGQLEIRASALPNLDGKNISAGERVYLDGVDTGFTVSGVSIYAIDDGTDSLYVIRFNGAPDDGDAGSSAEFIAALNSQNFAGTTITFSGPAAKLDAIVATTSGGVGIDGDIYLSNPIDGLQIGSVLATEFGQYIGTVSSIDGNDPSHIFFGDRGAWVGPETKIQIMAGTGRAVSGTFIGSTPGTSSFEISGIVDPDLTNGSIVTDSSGNYYGTVTNLSGNTLTINNSSNLARLNQSVDQFYNNSFNNNFRFLFSTASTPTPTRPQFQMSVDLLGGSEIRAGMSVFKNGVDTGLTVASAKYEPDNPGINYIDSPGDSSAFYDIRTTAVDGSAALRTIFNSGDEITFSGGVSSPSVQATYTYNLSNTLDQQTLTLAAPITGLVVGNAIASSDGDFIGVVTAINGAGTGITIDITGSESPNVPSEDTTNKIHVMTSTATLSSTVDNSGNDVITFSISSANPHIVSGSVLTDTYGEYIGTVQSVSGTSITLTSPINDFFNPQMSSGAIIQIASPSDDAPVITENDPNSLNLVDASDNAAANGKIASSAYFDASGNVQSLEADDVADLSSEAVQGAIQINSTNRADLGAWLNRLDYAVDNMQTLSTNLADGISRIVDTDYAAETSNLTRTQILQQAATSMLAQANQMPNVILTLLK